MSAFDKPTPVIEVGAKFVCDLYDTVSSIYTVEAVSPTTLTLRSPGRTSTTRIRWKGSSWRETPATLRRPEWRPATQDDFDKIEMAELRARLARAFEYNRRVPLTLDQLRRIFAIVQENKEAKP